jgi:hypothetical protein
MAEIQWVVEVRCVNTLLAEFKVGERGQHICAHIPNRELDPHEFSKLIEGAEEASRIAEKHRSARKKPAVSQAPAPLDAELGTVSEVEGRKDLYEIQILKTGEIASVNLPGAVFGPSELDQFITELKTIQSRLAPSQ